MICVPKTKAMIRFGVTTKLVSAFVFTYANCWFSDVVAQFQIRPFQFFSMLSLRGRVGFGPKFRKINKKNINK